MIARSHLWLGLALAAAMLATLFKIPVASSQGVTLLASQVSGELPLTDPVSPAWRQTTAVDVPLSAQNVTKPMSLETTVKTVTARALHNGSQLAILVEWADETQNDQVVRVQDFRDAVAVQFPLAEGQPYFCMGQQGANVNIWHWKADWQADLAARADVHTVYPNMVVDQYPFADPAAGNLFAAEHASPVEDLIAGGFGSLTAQPAAGQNVRGFGVWEAGKWRVIFSRDFESLDADDVTFSVGKVYSMAFAAWDGANDERNGQKSTSQWISLQIEGASPRAVGTATPMPPSAAGLLFGLIPVLAVMLLTLGLAGGLLLFSKWVDKQ